jgi:hypothetical protein
MRGNFALFLDFYLVETQKNQKGMKMKSPKKKPGENKKTKKRKLERKHTGGRRWFCI